MLKKAQKNTEQRAGGSVLKKTFMRLALALALSLSVWRGSLYLSKKFESVRSTDLNQKPVAIAKQVSDEVERRPVTSLVWSVIEPGEDLYAGEAIKTSSYGEVRIQFKDSNRFIDLDPDSLIVISQGGNNEISLDLQGGSLFVSQGEKSAGQSAEPSLLLNSASGKVDLSNATAQLSKSSGKDIDVQVLKGKAKIESNGQSKEIDANKKLSGLEILSPALDRPFYVNPENPQPIQFTWKGFPPQTQVSLWAGKTRQDLKEISKALKPDETSLLAKLSVGKNFWKLVAEDGKTKTITQQSSIYRIEVVSRYAPSPVAPIEDAQLLLTNKPSLNVDFKWTKPEAIKSVYFEIGKDPAFKEKVFSKNILDQEAIQNLLPAGTYYWRLSGTYEGIDKPISSKTIKFTVAAEFKPKEPPKPISLLWINPIEAKPQFFIDEPLASLTWATEQNEKIKTFRLKIAPTAELLNQKTHPELISKETNSHSVKTPVQKPGRYIAMVEALDEKQVVLGKSEFKSIEIRPLPLLASPTFLPETGDLQSSNLGKLDLKWSAIPGAKEYWITLFDSSGKELRKAKFTNASTSLVNLLPGRYKVQVFAIDEHGRESEKLEPRWVLVPDSSGVNAPKLKKIQVR